MEISRQSCRLCLSESDFNVSLFGTYCRKTNMLDKILVCLKLVIEKTDHLNTICYKCAENVEKFYDFNAFIKQKQTKLCDNRFKPSEIIDETLTGVNQRHVPSNVSVREQVFDADYTFSFLEMCQNEEKKETQASSPFFSYLSPPNIVSKQPKPRAWKTPRARCDSIKKPERKSQFKTPRIERSRQHSGDLFESQSQDIEEAEPRPSDWKLTPDKSIMRRIREKWFGPLDF